MKTAVLLFGHGSRRDEANDALVRLCGLVERKRPGTKIAHAFLQFAKPDLPAALEALSGQDIDEVTVVPIFLYEGIHIREDIPEILSAEADKHPQMRLVLAPVLGIDERMAEIVLDRVDAAPRE
ncbi:MAG: CbiX/SirB N-terminal domain-containing protein [Bacillota bacterium]|nr:CbiX/SirB N-terminal domain-containing protein [Bacillota bacterium]